MALARDLASRISSEPAHRCASIRDALVAEGLYEASGDLRQGPIGPDGRRPELAVATQWRIAPAPLVLSSRDIQFFRSLGAHLLAFYGAVNRLYMESLRGTQPAWVAGYLDQGKPESLLTFSRMKRFRDALPAVIRPDIIPTEAGMVVTELDSVPGGIGLTAALSRAYAAVDRAAPPPDDHRPSPPADLVGGADGMLRGFESMVRAAQGGRPGVIAIVVSDEARDYRPEMAWVAARLREAGLDIRCVEPRELRFTEEGLWLDRDPVSLIYRFFELFDLPNVPKAELIMYAAKKDLVQVTPPFKPALEEKLAFALFHHPRLAPFWKAALGEERQAILGGLIPRTWVLDPSPLPPSAVIPNLRLGDRAVADWRDLAGASQRDRRYVVKPSGFSEMAWGSRGVSVGHDMPQTEWSAALDKALQSFPATPYVLQEFHKGRQFDLSYHEARSGEVVAMPGRARLSPYYFVADGKAELGGILATVCSLEKKLIHGMRDAIMVPVAEASPKAE